ncbi:titin-like isoform X3 [Penaeus japonicus]|uniref:titin-like isoform X3 n=1 Tax=Penaeus japonicus TaxID=27405 RepID=UPI001C70E254|nr:titin-like isoform X3 [Penaeus japonicus]
MSGEFGTGKTIFVLAIVVGCFAVLWPKIFYPMLTASVKHPTSARQVSWRNEANLHFADQLCYLLEEHYVTAVPSSTPSAASSSSSSSSSISGVRWSAEECWLMVWQTCGHEMNESLVEDVRLGRDKSNLTECLTNHFGLTPSLVASAAPPRVRLRPYLPQSMGGHARPERPAHLYPEMMHPALREKGRAMPQRTIDKQARPGPMPGIRPPMGGAGGMVPPPQGKGSGAMGIIMPLYTVGIVVFFVYTIMKVLFKKGPDDDKTPKLKDFGLDPEYRKYVFAEEYLDNAEISTRDQMRRQAREESRSRKKVQQDQVPDTKIGQRRLPSEGGLDTQGKKLGEWYLPEGFLDIVDEDSEYEDTIGGTTINECIHETIRSRLQDGICANKKDSHLRKHQTFPKHGHQNLYGDDDYRSLGAQNSSREFSESLRSMTHSKENPLPENFELEDDYLADESFSCSNDFLKLIEEKLTNCDEGSDYENFKELFLMAQEHIKIKQQIYDEETGEHFDNEHTENSEDEEDSPPEVTGKTDEECHIDQYATNCDSSQPQEYEDGSQEERTDTYQDEHDYASNQGKSECDKISTAISGILAELDQFSSELETRQQQKKEELSRMMMMEREKRNNECKHETQQKRDRIGLDSVMETAAASAANADKKEEVGDITSEEELTSSEALTTTMSEDNSLPTSLQQHLHALQVEQLNSYSELSVDVIPQEEGEQVPSTKTEAQLDLITDEGEVETVLPEQKEVTVDPTLYQSTVDTLALCKELEVEISELQVNVDVPQKEEVADTSSPSPKQTDLAQEEGNVEGGHEEEEQVATPADVEQGQLDVVELEEDKLQSAEPKEDEPQSTEPKEVEPQSAEPKEVEPQSAEPKEVEPQSTEPKEAEPQSAESKEVEPQSAEPKEVEPQSAEPKEVEPQSAEPKEDEPQSAEPKEVELQPAEHQKVEPQPAEPEEVESQPAEPKEVEPQPAEPKEIETESAEPKEDEPQTAEPIEDGNQHEVIQEEEVVNEEQKVNLPLETEQQESAEKQIMEESKVSREDAVPKVTSEDTEQKQAEPANTCEETPQPAAKDSTTCIMTFISDTADQLGKVVSDEEPQKEDPGTPDEAEASPVPLLKEIAARTPKLSPDDAQGANAEAEDSSEATETGADISDLKSFAEESHAHEKQHLVEEIPAPIPEEEYCPSIRVGLMDEAESEESAVLCKGQGTQTSLAMSLTPPQAVSKEHSTQTDEEQGVAVLGVQTSFLHDEGGVETKAGSHGPVKTEGVTEILLDALLPSETQLLIKDTQVVGSKPSQNVEIDASEAEGVPCIVTSHVSLAFVGLDSQKPENLTLISADGKKTESMKAVSVKSEPAAAQTPVSQESKTDCEQKPESLIDKNKATEMQAACQKDITVDAKHTEESNQTGKDTESADRCHTAPKASEQELEPKEIQNEVGNEPLPDSPSLEAIAEAVAAATTRAALDLLATTNSDTLIKPQEVKEAVSSPSILSKESPNLLPKTADTASLENTKAVTSESEEEERKPSEQVTEASRSQTQGDAPQSSTVYVATVTHTPSESPSSTPEKEKTQESVEADLIKASLPQAETPPETVKTSQSGAVPPVPISQGVVVTKTVEAALAEAAEEVCDISMNKETKHQDTTATQDHQGVATVSPNEDSPISSKGSSPDMEEYEVINKDEDTAHKLRTQRETSSGEPVIDKVKAAESTEVSSQAAQLHTGEEAPSEKENETQKEEKVVKGKERSRSKEPEEKKSSDKANICEDQGKDSPSCPVDDSSSAKATDPEASHCTPSDSLGAEEGQTDIDSSTSKENVSSDNADSE